MPIHDGESDSLNLLKSATDAKAEGLAREQAKADNNDAQRERERHQNRPSFPRIDSRRCRYLIK
jgi:hypothetical protein